LVNRFEFLRNIIGDTSGSVTFLTQLFNNLPEIISLVVDFIVNEFLRLADIIEGMALIFKGLFKDINFGFSNAVAAVKFFGKAIITSISFAIGAIESLTGKLEVLAKLSGEVLPGLTDDKDIKEGIKKITDAISGGFGDFRTLKADLKALFLDATETAKIESEKVGAEAGKAFSKGFVKSATKDLKKGLKDLDKGFDELFESRRKRAEVAAAETTELRIKDFQEAALFDKDKLDAAIAAIKEETALRVKSAKERSNLLLQQGNLSKNDLTRIREEGEEAIRLIEKTGSRKRI